MIWPPKVTRDPRAHVTSQAPIGARSGPVGTLDLLRLFAANPPFRSSVSFAPLRALRG
jgi:hypothetical protein